MTRAVDIVMLCESALWQGQWGKMDSSHTNVGPLGATPRPWLVRHPKSAFVSSLPISQVASANIRLVMCFPATRLVSVGQKQCKVVGREGTDRKYRVSVQSMHIGAPPWSERNSWRGNSWQEMKISQGTLHQMKAFIHPSWLSSRVARTARKAEEWNSMNLKRKGVGWDV